MTTVMTTMASPVGRLRLVATDGALSGLYLPTQAALDGVQLVGPEVDPTLLAATQQITAYFEGHRRAFDLPLRPRGTAFQVAVWAALREIPFGQTRSYGELAQTLGRPTASRAVGAANGRNPIAIVVPCHRVLGRSGALTGYAGGVETKRWLLAHEGALAMSLRV